MSSIVLSYFTHKSVSTKTVARWLKEVLSSSGIDTGILRLILLEAPQLLLPFHVVVR